MQPDGWCGEIVGPHGSGKTTLLMHLLEFAADTGQRTRGLLFTTASAVSRPTGKHQSLGALMVAVDGYEQLGWWGRRRLKTACRTRGTGLIVTVHCADGIAHALPHAAEPARRPPSDRAAASARRGANERGRASPSL